MQFSWKIAMTPLALALLFTRAEEVPQDQSAAALPAPPSAVPGGSPTVRELRPGTDDQDYVIGAQDLLGINVWHEPEISQSVPVRPDGKISLPLVGDLKVSGLTPRLLQNLLAKELEAYVRKPQVTVIVREVNSHKFYIMGEVGRPGEYSLATSVTVLDALATVGGFRDFAKVQKIYLLRLMPDGSQAPPLRLQSSGEWEGLLSRYRTPKWGHSGCALAELKNR